MWVVKGKGFGGFWGNLTRLSPLLLKPVKQGSGYAKGAVRVERRKERSVRTRDADRKTLLEVCEKEFF